MAPRELLSLSVGVNYLSSAGGNYLAGELGSKLRPPYADVDAARFFASLAALALANAFAIAASARSIDRVMEAKTKY